METYDPSTIKCTDQDFLTSARLYRKDLLRRPVRRLDKYKDLFTVRSGIRYEEKVGTVDADLEFGPYNPKRTADLDVQHNFRKLRTYFGSVRREFDPNAYFKTVLGSAITKGDALKSTEITRLVLNIVSAKLGDSLARHLFDAVRNDAGDKTVDLFNGWDTIAAAEIKAGNISAAKNNLFSFSEAIDSTNAVDAVKAFCRAADDFLLEQDSLNLILPRKIYQAYLDDYQATVGPISYNDSFKKLHPDEFENITFRPIFQKKDSDILNLTTKSNMLIGVNQMGEEENVIVEKHDVVLLTFFATMFFGCEFESIDPERMLVGKLAAATSGSGSKDPGTSTSGTTGSGDSQSESGN